jgi:hypothetical protein
MVSSVSSSHLLILGSWTYCSVSKSGRESRPSIFWERQSGILRTTAGGSQAYQVWWKHSLHLVSGCFQSHCPPGLLWRQQDGTSWGDPGKSTRLSTTPFSAAGGSPAYTIRRQHHSHLFNHCIQPGGSSCHVCGQQDSTAGVDTSEPRLL